MTSASNAVIIERACVDAPAFAKIFDRHFTSIHGYLGRRVGEAADDLAAEVFTIAFLRRAAYDLSRRDALPWLYGIASDLVLARCRRAQRDQALLERLPARPEVRESGDPQELLAGITSPEADAMRDLVGRLSDDETRAQESTSSAAPAPCWSSTSVRATSTR